MAKRLLILSEPLTPPSYSPRLTSLIHYLEHSGWKCTLECEPVAANHLADVLFRTREKQFSKRLTRTYKAQDFDAIFCSTFYYFPLLTAYRISKAWHLPLIVDVRDIAEQWGKASYFTSPLPKLFGLERLLSRIYVRRNISMRNRVLRHASAVTTVSPWHQQYLQSLTKAPVSLIYNGYDENEIQPKDVKTNTFRIAYIGRLISLQLRQPQMLFQAVSELTCNPSPVTTNLSLDFYSEPHLAQDLKQLAAQYHIEDKLHLHDYIARDEIGEVMSQASILLALGAPASMQQHGILGTKVFEAIGIEKPFMLIPSDEENLAQLITDTGIGVAASTTEEIKAFILEQYAQWQKNGFTRRTVADKTRFSRQHAAQEFQELILSTLNMKHSTLIIIPAYNASKYIAECLCSVKNQTYEHWHCIIVDDGSTDNTASIAQAFVDADQRFTLLRHESNRGQSAARNTALDYVSSLNAKRSTLNDFITFLDADDWLDKNHLQTLVNNIGDKDILQVGYRRISDNGLVLEEKTPRHFHQFTSPCLRLYRAQYLLQADHFKEGMIYEDVIFSLNIWGSKPSYRILPYVGYNYRFNELSTTSQPNPAARKTLYAAIRQTKAPWWLQRFTTLRLKMHFRHE